MPENPIPSRRLAIVGAEVPNQDHDSGRALALPAHTYGHLDCPACEALRSVTLSRISPSQTVGEAAELWLTSRSVTPVSRARYIRQSTEKSYRQYTQSLSLFFKDTPLEKIHLGNLRAYQEARIVGADPFIRKRRPNKNEPIKACPAAPKKVNQELSVLKMIMRRAGVWSQELDEFYEPYSEDLNDVQRALSPQEQRRWLEVAKTRERWWLVWWYSVLAFETSMSTNEIRSLRLGDVNLYHGVVSIGSAGAKNRYRVRTIPLVSAEVKWVTEQLVARAKDLGAGSPMHYLFPFRRPPGPWDPTRSMTASGIKRQWEEVREAAGLKWFRPYDTRHTAITRWAESGMNIADIMALAGHMSPRMSRHYTHIGDQAKRRALEGVMSGGKLGPQPVTIDQAGYSPFYIPTRQGGHR